MQIFSIYHLVHESVIRRYFQVIVAEIHHGKDFPIGGINEFNGDVTIFESVEIGIESFFGQTQLGDFYGKVDMEP